MSLSCDALLQLGEHRFPLQVALSTAPNSVTAPIKVWTAVGRVVEALTDPNNSGCILVLTFPVVRFSHPRLFSEKDELNLPTVALSESIQVSAVVFPGIKEELLREPHAEEVFVFLSNAGVAVFFSVDTRAISCQLPKDTHTAEGTITLSSPNASSSSSESSAVRKSTQLSEPIHYASARKEKQEASKKRILLIDAGVSTRTIKHLLAAGWDVLRHPATAPLPSFGFEAIVVSSGPLHRSLDESSVKALNEFLHQHASNIPVLAVGSGSLSLARLWSWSLRPVTAPKDPVAEATQRHPYAYHISSGRLFAVAYPEPYALDAPKSNSDSSDIWTPIFRNSHPDLVEGWIHSSKPWSVLAFDPDACDHDYNAVDSEVLWSLLLPTTNTTPNTKQAVRKPSVPSYSKVLVLGSGGISIGHAGAYDLIGAQALKALKEAHYQTVLINPNGASLQTTHSPADSVYHGPLLPEFVQQVIENERPDYVLPGFGGTQALECLAKLHRENVLAKYNVKSVGTPLETIIRAEDRTELPSLLGDLSSFIPPAKQVRSLFEAVSFASAVEYPVIVRPIRETQLDAMRSSNIQNDEQLSHVCQTILASNDQILIEKSLAGWKRVDIELLRDSSDNTRCVANMEYLDPVGIHSGDSVVVVPALTVPADVLSRLKYIASRVASKLSIVGYLNVHFAINPDNMDFKIARLNTVVKQSCILASSALGYPLARIAAKVSMGHHLDSIINNYNGVLSAFSEPLLGHVAVKIPRWDLKKFDRADVKISDFTKSVGEVLGVGRSFEEALQKAIRMCDSSFLGFDHTMIPASEEELVSPSYQRLFALASALADPSNFPLEKIAAMTRIDTWFLHKLQAVVQVAKELSAYTSSTLPAALVLKAKLVGFSDAQIAHCIGITSLAMRSIRSSMKIFPYVKQLGGTVGLYPCKSKVLYLTYRATQDDVTFSELLSTNRSVIVLGSGVYRIGSGPEYDVSVVNCSRTLRSLGVHSVIVNCNPESVSNDFDESDRLYWEELSLEKVLDIYEREAASGVIASMGGPRPYRLSMRLSRQNVRVIGTTPEMIDDALNRFHFSRLLDRLGVDQPAWKRASTIEEAVSVAESIGFPCLVRTSPDAPSRIVNATDDFKAIFQSTKSLEPIIVSKYITDAKELEIAGVAKGGEVVIHTILEHIENAGVHSNDSTVVLPAQDLDAATTSKVESATKKITRALNLSGCFNIRFVAKDNAIQVIECSLRASALFPFIHSTLGVDLVSIGTKIMMDRPVKSRELVVPSVGHIGVKVPQFSFANLQGVDPVLGIETSSTGQVVCFGKNRAEAYFKGILATGFRVPQQNILLSVGSYKHKQEILEHARKLQELGFNLFGTKGTAEFLAEHGVNIQELDWNPSMDGTGIMEYISSAKIHLFINIPSKSKSRRMQTYVSKGYYSRRLAVDFSVPLITDIKCAKLFIESLGECRSVEEMRLSKYDMRTSHRRVSLPGFVGVGIQAHKSDLWREESAAIVSSGFTTAVVFPSAATPLQTYVEVEKWLKSVSGSSYCSYLLSCSVNQANLWNISTISNLASTKPLALMLSLNEKEGSAFYLPNVTQWMTCFESWPSNLPIVLKAESTNLAAALLVADLHKKSVHFLDVKRKEELLVIQMAKKRGLQVTCSTNVSALFLDNSQHGSSAQQEWDYLWTHIDQIDCISLEESDSYPISYTLPLLLTAVKEGKISLEELSAKLSRNPRRIFHLSDQDDSICEVDLDDEYVLESDAKQYPDNPFAGRLVCGRVRRVTMNGQTVYLDGKIVTSAMAGKNVVLTPAKPVSTAVSAPEARPFTPDSPKTFLKSPAQSRALVQRRPGTPTHDKIEEIPLPFDLQSTDKRNVSLQGQSILSVKQFDKNALQYIFDQAHEMRKMVERVGYFDLLKGRVLCALFYEPSTRTSSSFIAAMERLGGSVVAINSVKDSSVSKGETLADTVRTMEAYVDVIVLRHPEKGAAKLAAKYARKPIVNAGDGVGEHPTQALLDTFTIREELGTLNGLTVTMLGDLKHGRTVHSLSQLLSLYDVKLIYVSPESLSMPDEIYQEVQARGVSQRVSRSLEDVLPETDVLYVTRVQKERFATEEEYMQVKGAYKITPELLTIAKENMIIMHPLPRVDEITPEVDSDPRAAYFRQMQYGMYVRMSLLAMILGKA
eukprot:TRINITY_DN6476_c0_g2_i1.p1 TRINITY_DN6476_c0_g2~~TRINITY_DN6476_c0_g2_i1.p1  ORF type:complete len:2163 (-),score=440.22 TRINITY_DN6476_c0_g2_i1:281-6769(-)